MQADAVLFTGTDPGADAEAPSDAMVASLLRPGAYDHPAYDLRLFETHISWVILAGRFAYKVKKPVNLGFLDFRTRARRAADCADEVRLNRRLCPDVYLGIRQIVERHGAYHIGGAGRHVEPVVWMRRLPADGMLPELLARGAVGPDLARRIARRLAAFHAAAATGPGVDEYGSLDTIRANWDENLAQTVPFIGRTVDADLHAGMAQWTAAFIAANRALLDRRVRNGRIREGHGDLHAGSICVEDDRIILFDCLEFAPRFRCSDVAAEVAFLAMDLDHFGRPDLGAAFVDEYVRRAADADLLLLLPFYWAYRAWVRGKVASLRLLEGDLTTAQAAALTGDARAYFQAAARCAGLPTGPGTGLPPRPATG